MSLFVKGRPATQGTGPPRWTLRIPLWLADNVRVGELEKLRVGDTTTISIAGRTTTIERRESFYVLRMSNFMSDSAANDMWRDLSLALVRLSARTGAALQFPSPLAEIAREGDPNFRFRDQLQDSDYPPDWSKRVDGTITDGGIFPHDACILPEHERIWEYPIFWGRVLRVCNLAQLDELALDSRGLRACADEDSIRTAARALWVACAQPDRRVRYILLVTTLEILASDEKLPNRTADVERIVAQIRVYTSANSDDPLDHLLQELSKKLRQIRAPGMADKIRSLVLKAFGNHDTDTRESKELTGEVNGILRKRAFLAHGGKFLSPPTADENERLQTIVARALDQRLRDLAGGGVPQRR